MDVDIAIRSAVDGSWLNVEPVRLGKVPSGRGTADQYALVTAEGLPSLRIDLFYARDQESFAFELTQVWAKWVVLCRGNHVFLVDIASRVVRDVDLGAYFSCAWSDAACLLVASAERVFRIAPEGNVVWSSQPVGVDGVTISRAEDGVVYGEGEYDPPGGWRPFRLALDTGRQMPTSPPHVAQA